VPNGLLDHIAGFLFDLDGVLYVGDKPIEGAAETITWLRERHIPTRFCTNTTVLSDASLLKKLNNLGLPVVSEELFGAIRAALSFLRKHGTPRCHLLLTDDPRQDFEEFPQTEDDPQFVVIGDVCKSWDYDLMQKTFLMVMNGAEMLALHKGRYWQTETGLRMDIGAFVAGLEYVTGKAATVIGKPSRSFFELALDDMGLPAEQVAMVGDDINSDIGGAQDAGMKSILVKTGKYREDLVAASSITPELVIDSVGDLPSLIR
jgi:HAD superfamily hydrolase (TIGR01458 family)